MSFFGREHRCVFVVDILCCKMAEIELQESAFRSKVQSALENVRRVLDLCKNPTLPTPSHPHTYGDKFALAEFLGISAIAAILKCFQKLGMNIEDPQFQELKKISETKSISLRFETTESCQFIREVVTEEEISRSETKIFAWTSTKRVLQTVKRYHWRFRVNYSLYVFIGSQATEKVSVLREEASECEVVTSTNASPYPEVKKHEPVDLNVTWLLQHLDAENKVFFCINRFSDECRTPRRNPEIEGCLCFFEMFNKFCGGVGQYFRNHLFGVDQSYHHKRKVTTSGIFVPILPLFENYDESVPVPPLPSPSPPPPPPPPPSSSSSSEIPPILEVTPVPLAEKKKGKLVSKGPGKKRKEDTIRKKRTFRRKPSKDSPHSQSRMLTIQKLIHGDFSLFYSKEDDDDAVNEMLRQSANLFHSFQEEEDPPLVPFHYLPHLLSHQSKTLKERISELNQLHLSKGTLITANSAIFVCLVLHGVDIVDAFQESIDYIEHMIRQQLIQAIGYCVNSYDFNEYMKFHNRKVFLADYRPEVFAYPIRRPDHVPEGVLSIEQDVSDSRFEPILTASRRFLPTEPMKMSLSASASLEVWGDRHIHAWTAFQFSDKEASLNLVARTREFSGFIMMIGSLPTNNLFVPKFGIILQNKDEVKIPLMLEQIPTKKEFAEKINSLSPEQQAFSKAYRDMQMSSTLFGIFVIHIKPQMERLLKLPYDSLTKQIELTQDLLKMFLKFQIPSDLLTYDGDPSAPEKVKVQKVGQNVQKIHEIIKEQEQEELKLEQNKQKMELLECGIVESYSESDYSESDDDEGWDEEDECEELEYKKCEENLSYALEEDMCFGDEEAMPMMMMKKESKKPQRKKAMKIKDKSKDMKVKEKGGKEGKEKEKVKSQKNDKKKEKKEEEKKEEKKEEEKKEEGKKEEEKKEEGKKEEKDQSKKEEEGEGKDVVLREEGEDFDITTLPKLLEDSYEKNSVDGAVRPTIVTASDTWELKTRESLLQEFSTEVLEQEELQRSFNTCLDLLDSLSRSGSCPIECASLHVMVGSTHRFDKSLIETVVQDNVNPIEAAEISNLVATSVVHGRSVEEMTREQHAERLSEVFKPE